MPAADRFGYQWFADGHPIAGATGPTHTLTAGQLRTVITVQVTASLAGYQDAVDVSEPTAPVATDRAPQLTLAADVDRLRRGQSATLTWTSLDAASISPGGAWPGSSGGGDMPLSGTATVEPRSLGAHTYLLTATNDNGTTTARVTIVVGREATDLTVQAPGSRRRGATFRVRARGLDAGEVFTIRFAGRAVAAGRADERGHVTRRVTVPMTTPLGMTRVRVIGSRPDRDGQDLLRVLPDRGH